MLSGGEFKTIACLAAFISQVLGISVVHAKPQNLQSPLSIVAETNGFRAPISVIPEQLDAELNQLQAQIQSLAYPISLEDAIAIGLRNNTELLQAFSTIQQFEWQLIAAQRQWYPTLRLQNGTPFIGANWETFVNNNFAISADQLTAEQQQRQQAVKSQQFVVQPGVVVSWNAIDPTRQPNINAAKNTLNQQKYLFDVGARNLVLNIQQAFFSLQNSQQLIDDFQQIYTINKQQLKIMEARKSIGMVTVLELEQTRSQLFSQLNQLILFTQNYIEQSAVLAQSLALPRDQLAIPADPARMHGKWTLSESDTVSRALQQREEILASLSAAEAAEWTAVAAIRSYLPVFSFVASGNLAGSNGYQSVPVPIDPGQAYARNRLWSAAVGIGFNWTLFDGGVQAAQAEAAKAQARQQQATAASSEFQVVQEVRSSFARMKTSLVALRGATQAYRSAELAQDAARARFEVGVGDITSVVQTIQQLSQAANQRAQALLRHNLAVSQLYRFSATWPNGTEQERDKRIETMRRHSRTTSLSSAVAKP